MSIELRGLAAAAVAAFAVLGLTFGLAAVMRATQPSAPPPGMRAGGAGTNPQAVLVATGQGFYAQSCARCHGGQGQGVMGPALRHSDQSDAQIAATIKQGVPQAMPAFGSKYKEPDVKALIAYIRSLK